MYLKQSVKIEPLIHSWYAWPHLLNPFSLAANIKYRYMKIMRSYIQNPQIHVQAVADPKMIGGPFVDLEKENVESVRKLLREIETSYKNIIDLNTAFREFDTLLQEKASGESLEGLYAQAPEILRGLFELVYDINNNPSIRLIEPLLYSKFYSSHNQSICISNNPVDFRKFVLSTPRVIQDNELHLQLPFSSTVIDKLSAMTEKPQNIQLLAEELKIEKNYESLFNSFFTRLEPTFREDRNYNGKGLRIRYFGHACVLVQAKNLNIILDPFIAYAVDESPVERYTLLDLPETIDYVFITHIHQDHTMLETLLRIRYKIKNIVVPRNNKGSVADPSLKLMLLNLGFKSVIEMDEFDEIDFINGNGKAIALPFLGEHADLNIQSKLGYVIQLEGKKILFAADSNNLDPNLYMHLNDMLSGVDILFVGLECDGAPLNWLYGPLLTTTITREQNNSRRLSGSNYEKAKLMVDYLECKVVYVYAMGKEPWLNHIMALDRSEDTIQHKEAVKLINYCNDKKIESLMLYGKLNKIFCN